MASVSANPQLDLEKLRGFKSGVVKKLTSGLSALAKQRKVELVTGTGKFVSPQVIEVTGPKGSERIRFDSCIIAAGSEAVKLPGWPSDPRIIDSTGALELPSRRWAHAGGGRWHHRSGNGLCL